MVDVLDAVRGVLPAVAEKAGANDRNRKIDETVVRDLVSAGVFGMMTPTRFGGLESSLADLFAVVRSISAQCASTGWVVASHAVNSWQVALFSEEAQELVWGPGPGQLIASAYQPAGRFRSHGDGYLLSGTWRNLSGCEHSDWVFLGGLIIDDAGSPMELGLALIRTERVRMTPSAECIGLRGAASADIVLNDVFIPEHCVYIQRIAGDGRRNQKSRSALYRQSQTVLYSSVLTIPLIGAADGAYAAILAQLRGSPGSDWVSLEIARAEAEIDRAARQLESTLTERRASGFNAEPIENVVRARRDQVLAAELATSAVDRIVRVGGRRAMMTESPIQRAWRDIHVGASHRVSDVEHVLTLFGRTALGLDVKDEGVFL